MLLWLGDPSPVRRWPAGWSDGYVTTDVSLALPWVVVGSDVLRSRTVRQEKSVFNRSSYEVGVHRSACQGGPRWVRDRFGIGSEASTVWSRLRDEIKLRAEVRE